ncbi:MAG: MotA/TolQ/ExbB proton channel family protein [Fusobacteriaceae bacterium]|jgi:biopolymer transport protein ExbB|nr:MotA/TolQ/ExbB proton channel family protein [Fusobacteriaceae bacterium]
MYWVKSGGILMYFIIAMSIIGITVIIERLVYFKVKERDNTGEITPAIKKYIEKGSIKEAVLALDKEKSSSSRVLCDVLIYYYKTKNSNAIALDEKAKECAMAHLPGIERNMWMLSLVANATPLLGLLGTVFGMIKCFHAVSIHGTGDASILAIGISEALITTAAGLIAAIPALFFYNYFNKKIDEIVSYIEKNSAELVNIFR